MIGAPDGSTPSLSEHGESILAVRRLLARLARQDHVSDEASEQLDEALYKLDERLDALLDTENTSALRKELRLERLALAEEQISSAKEINRIITMRERERSAYRLFHGAVADLVDDRWRGMSLGEFRHEVYGAVMALERRLRGAEGDGDG